MHLLGSSLSYTFYQHLSHQGWKLWCSGLAVARYINFSLNSTVSDPALYHCGLGSSCWWLQNLSSFHHMGALDGISVLGLALPWLLWPFGKLFRGWNISQLSSPSSLCLPLSLSLCLPTSPSPFHLSSCFPFLLSFSPSGCRFPSLSPFTSPSFCLPL